MYYLVGPTSSTVVSTNKNLTDSVSMLQTAGCLKFYFVSSNHSTIHKLTGLG